MGQALHSRQEVEDGRTALIFSQGASSLTLRINRASARRMLVVRSIPAVDEVPPLVSSAELSEATASGLY